MASRHAPHFFSYGLPTFIILGVVFLGALAITGGLIPSKRKPPPSNYQIGELDIPPGSSSQFNLQLNTLKFKNITPPCENTLTLDFLLDITGSMNSLTPSGRTKLSRLKEAVLAITQNLTDDSVIGIQAFNSNIISQPAKMDIIPISHYGSVKGLIPSRVNALIAGGQTPTYYALVFSYNKLAGALPIFPGRKFNFILISDGEPVPLSQDPRKFTPNPANQIRSLVGIENVYTVGVYDTAQAGNPALSDLLKSIASSPSKYYEAESADQIQALLSAIKTDICN